MIDPSALIGHVLHSPWLLPLVALAVVCDGPFPFIPSEPILFSATGAALAVHDHGRVAALFCAALLGSLVGDALLYGMGRSSNAFLRSTPRDAGIGAWARRHLHRRPVVALVATRLLPGGRLAGVTAAGRVRLPLRAFLPASLTASVVWSTWMTGIGALVGPLTQGDPLRCVLAGLLLAALVGTLAALGRRFLRARRRVAVTA